MTSKVILSMLGASLVMGLSASALAQGNRGDNDRRSNADYSQNDDTRGQKARDNDRNQNARAGNRGRNDARTNNRGRNDARAGNRGRNDARTNNRRRGPRTKMFNTRFPTTSITLRENIVRSRRGPRKFCTVVARGPHARLVPKKRLRKIARNNCSRRAKVKISRVSTFKARRR